MRCYIVTFDTADVAVRKKVRELLKTYSGHCPVHRHCWAILTDRKAPQIRNHIAALLGPKDRLFIVRSGTAAAWKNSYGPKHTEWLKNNL